MSTYEQWASNLQTLPGNDQASPNISQWDFVTIGGIVMPGVSKVSAKAGDGLDVQKPKGGKRASVIDNGDPLIEFSIVVELLPDELQQFRDFVMPILKPTGKRKGRAPLEFLHPLSELWGVDTVIVRGISTPAPESGGTMKIKIACIEHVDAPVPVKRTKKKEAGKASGTASQQVAEAFVEEYYDTQFGPPPPEPVNPYHF